MNKFLPLKKKLPALRTHSKFISTVMALPLEIVRKSIEDQSNVPYWYIMPVMERIGL